MTIFEKQVERNDKFLNGYPLHTDSSHGWLEVPVDLIELLGIRYKISKYSYKRDGMVYLEEDCDLSLFIREYQNQMGREPMIRRGDHSHESKIRCFERYLP